jgi:hypothetical protein
MEIGYVTCGYLNNSYIDNINISGRAFFSHNNATVPVCTTLSSGSLLNGPHLILADVGTWDSNENSTTLLGVDEGWHLE